MPRISSDPAVTRRRLYRGRKGMFLLCDDATNGRIYYRRDGKRSWSRYAAPEDPGKRLSLTVGKRGLFCLVGNGQAGALYFRRFGKGNHWVRYNGPRSTPSGR